MAEWQTRIFDVIDQAAGADVVLDLSGVTFIDSTGSSVLSRVRTHCLQSHVRLVLRASARLLSLLAVTGMPDVFEIAPGI